MHAPDVHLRRSRDLERLIAHPNLDRPVVEVDEVAQLSVSRVLHRVLLDGARTDDASEPPASASAVRLSILDATGGKAKDDEIYAAVLRSEWRVALEY
jgi:hypothetical protein